MLGFLMKTMTSTFWTNCHWLLVDWTKPWFQFCCEWDNILSLLFSNRQHLFIVVLFCANHTQAKRCKEKTFYIYRTCEEGFWKVFWNLTIPFCHHLKPLWIRAYGYNLWNHGCLCYFPQYYNKRWKRIMWNLSLNKQI